MARALLYIAAVVLLLCSIISAEGGQRRRHQHHHRAVEERATNPSVASTTTLTTTTTSQVTSTTTTKLTSSTETSSLSTSTISTSTSKSTTAESTSAATTTSSKSSTTTSLKSTTTTSSKTSTTSSKTSTSTTKMSSAATINALAAAATPSYWLEAIKHQGYAPFSSSPSTYKVYRNVKEFGAKGDGKTDDTAAINSAITAGNRCGQGCDSSTTTPALIYFPAGTYLVSQPIQAYYFSQLIGNPLNMPIIKATSTFQGYALFDGNPVVDGTPFYTPQNNFYRVIKNFVIDTTSIPASSYGTGVHWRVAQATSLQNLVFKLSTASGNNHQGIYMEDGSGGYMSDIVVYGGKFGAYLGSQQFSTRNMTTYNTQTAVYMAFDWTWTFIGLTVNGGQVGVDISASTAGSVTLLDSTFINVPIGILTSRSASTTPVTQGSFIMENVKISNVPKAVARASDSATILAGTTGSTTIVAWGQGHQYTPRAKGTTFQGTITKPTRSSSLLDSTGKFIGRSKPNYETEISGNFISARSQGAKGDGKTDDTVALQKTFTACASGKKVLYFDFGVYLVTNTVYVPAGCRIFGEAWPVITGTGAKFQNQKVPLPVLQIGKAGEKGLVEIQNIVVQTKGPSGGAILIEYNLATAGIPSGLWDVHTRVGGSAGTSLQSAQCPKTPSSTAIKSGCMGAFMLMHITTGASNLVMENNWLWTADHELDVTDHGQITVFSGRGLLIESTNGPFWLYGTAVEHNVLYQYQFSKTKNIFMGHMQTETPYYQGNPNALKPFTVSTTYNDPNYTTMCAGKAACEKSLGIRMVGSSGLFAYGTGLYSFFDNYAQTCLNTESCQTNMISIETCTNVRMYNVNTKGSTNMISVNNAVFTPEKGNANTFCETVAYFSLQ